MGRVGGCLSWRRKPIMERRVEPVHKTVCRSTAPGKASASLVQRPAPPGDPNFLRITVQNGGAAATTITNLGFYTYLSRWARFRRRYSSPCAVLQMYQGPQLPYKLDPGGEFVALMEQDEKFDGWLSLGNLWCFVDHSFPPKSPALAKYSLAQSRCGVLLPLFFSLSIFS